MEDKNKHKNEDKAIEFFKCFETANNMNREAFIELLKYTTENRKKTKK